RLNNNTFQVVGVLPPHFHFPHYRTNDIWTSLGEQANLMQERGNHPGIYVMGRLKPGVSLAAAEAEMKTIARALEQEYPDSNAGNTVRARALHEVLVENIRGPMVVLLVAVGLMLLVGCANVANLVLARSSARQSELAVRAAMGAGQVRLARQLFTESALLATVGAAAGLVVAWGGIRLLTASIPDNLPRAQEISVDWSVLAFGLAISLLTGIVFGLAPALQVSRSNLNAVLREEGRGGTASLSRQRLRQLLVASEFAFAVVLLVGTALMLKSLWNVLDADAGVQTDNVLTAQVRLTGESYSDPESRARFWERITNEVRSIPGVRQAGIVNPLFGGWQRGAYVEGDPLPKPGEYDPVDYATVTPGAMEALAIRLRQGRLFTEEDYLQKRNYVIVDETFVQKRLSGKEPLGQRLKMSQMPQSEDPWFEVIGVVGHVKNYGVDRDSRIEMWVTAAHFPASSGTIVAKTGTDPASVTPALRSAVRNLDAGLPLFLVRTLDEYVQRRTSDRRLVSVLLALFGVTALLLAAIGIYGVMSLSVEQRTQEMGIRLALGAKPGEVLALVVKQGFRMAGIGLVLGSLGALGLMRFAESQLFGVTATDAISYGIVLVVLSLVALAASLFPALRATRVNPVTALRYE
ncbi:MAG: ABC transporter permease, partial [Bryobacterales bacterium]|nr:ABC transporter permease [Bryobacterales bacterium]